MDSQVSNEANLNQHEPTVTLNEPNSGNNKATEMDTIIFENPDGTFSGSFATPQNPDSQDENTDSSHPELTEAIHEQMLFQVDVLLRYWRQRSMFLALVSLEMLFGLMYLCIFPFIFQTLLKDNYGISDTYLTVIFWSAFTLSWIYSILYYYTALVGAIKHRLKLLNSFEILAIIGMLGLFIFSYFTRSSWPFFLLFVRCMEYIYGRYLRNSLRLVNSLAPVYLQPGNNQNNNQNNNENNNNPPIPPAPAIEAVGTNILPENTNPLNNPNVAVNVV